MSLCSAAAILGAVNVYADGFDIKGICDKTTKEAEKNATSAVNSAAKSTDAAVANVTAPITGKAQTTCPVMGGAIDKKYYVDANGKRIYLCCSGCVAAVKADPDKFIKQLEAQGIVLEKTPAK